MLGLIISLIVVGLIAGFIARAVVPGRQNLGILKTILLGIVGSFVGGFLGFLIFQHDVMDGFFQPAGIIGSIIGAIIVLLVYVKVGGRSNRSVRR
ncbi:GlsB/YeaQ/YmgE family stress response membrane protein [Clavibacter zhangzhiyongii]|uniref:GlsB/YeaQ/YmgE family stress response membrane protein n=1 Tax=Clavibacter zhangzhiyongii TaxID=2768071 RepID=UPI00195C7BD0|nr:GlsB/YeaQ/YmgE family stress response membrane protein [Clavibacter zhangzhiyongii]MBM7025974.1 GlsB/YeaQ/YmgE family stress response membrane protein [Clavibacter zhangzhiyongii]